MTGEVTCNLNGQNTKCDTRQVLNTVLLNNSATLSYLKKDSLLVMAKSFCNSVFDPVALTILHVQTTILYSLSHAHLYTW